MTANNKWTIVLQASADYFSETTACTGMLQWSKQKAFSSQVRSIGQFQQQFRFFASQHNKASTVPRNQCKEQLVSFVQPLSEKLNNRVSVPLVYTERLFHLTILIEQFDDRIRSGRILHLQSRELIRSVTFDKRLDLGVSPQFSSTYY